MQQANLVWFSTQIAHHAHHDFTLIKYLVINNMHRGCKNESCGWGLKRLCTKRCEIKMGSHGHWRSLECYHWNKITIQATKHLMFCSLSCDYYLILLSTPATIFWFYADNTLIAINVLQSKNSVLTVLLEYILICFWKFNLYNIRHYTFMCGRDKYVFFQK